MFVRGIRGATTASSNTSQDILAATTELLLAMVQANGVDVSDLASIYFAMTSDLDAAFPAKAARDLGWDAISLLDAQTPRIRGDLPCCIRVLMHWNTERAATDIRHIYLGEAQRLRPDLLRPA